MTKPPGGRRAGLGWRWEGEQGRPCPQGCGAVVLKTEFSIFAFKYSEVRAVVHGLSV